MLQLSGHLVPIPVGGYNRGQAYVFSKDQGGANNWGQVKILSASDKAHGDGFGSSVTVSGDVVVVGGPGADSGGTNRGQAYVFSKDQGGANNWGLVKILTASDKTDDDYFGSSVTVSGDVVVVGAEDANSGGIDRGQAYVFSKDQGGANNWGLVKILTASDKTDYDFFGSSVTVSGDVVVVGAEYANSGGDYRGQAYVFDIATVTVAYPNGGEGYAVGNGHGIQWSYSGPSDQAGQD